MLESFGESSDEHEISQTDQSIHEICYSFSISINRVLKDENGRAIADQNSELVINFDKGGFDFIKRVQEVMGFEDIKEAFFRFMDYTMSANANPDLKTMSDEQKLDHMYEHLILLNTNDEQTEYFHEEPAEFNNGVALTEEDMDFTVPDFNFDDEDGLTL
jgi:hypothetical protein